MSAWPSTPRPAGVKIINEESSLISDAHNRRRQVVAGLGPRWALDLAWPPLTRDEWSECEGFALAQGATGIFTLTPHTHAAPLGAGLAAAMPATENRIRWSERLDLSPWAYTDAPNIVLGTAVAAPDGKTTGQLWSVYAANPETFPSVNQQIFVVLESAAVIACYMRYGSSPRSGIRLQNVSKLINHELTVTWTAGVPTVNSVVGVETYGITAVGGGWYRLWAFVNLVTGGESADSFKLHVCPRYNLASVGAGTYCWGAQVIKAAADLKSYLKTWGATRTVAAGPRVASVKNLIPYSDVYDEGWWGAPSNAQKIAGAIAPDGTQAQGWGSAAGLTGTQYPIIPGTLFVSTATQYVLSCYIKRGSASVFGFSIYDVTTATNYVARVNIAADGTMSFGTVVADTWGMEPIPGAEGWYRAFIMVDAESRGLSGHNMRPYFYPHLEQDESTPRPQEYSSVWRICLESGRDLPGHALRRYGVSDPETAVDSGKTVRTDGWVGSSAGVLKGGDFIRFAGHTKVYKVTAVADADTWGNVTLAIQPALTAPITPGQTITVADVPFTVSLDGPVGDMEWDDNVWIRPALRFVERI